MTRNGARARRVLFAATLLLAACGAPSAAPGEDRAYLQDASYRRAELAASLVNPANGYSQLRTQHYSSGAPGDWDRLPEWNPSAEPIAVGELDAPGGASLLVSAQASALALPDESADDAALLALGKAAFERYPVQLTPYFDVALASARAAESYGLWLDAARGVGGLVRVRSADGSSALGLTCSTCHAASGADGIEPGLPNAELNLGAALLDAGAIDPTTSAAIALWGPGRLDVTTTAGTEPARIPDLRPVRWLTHLHQDATLSVRDTTTLAIRIETLIITSSGQVTRPPRIVAWALALYVRSLAAALPEESAARQASPEGASVFATGCASCHASPGLTGPPVALAIIGTDPTLGLSADRGTGTYRVPSLHGVGTRGPLLHDGTIPSVDALLDPTRVTDAFSARLHGSGAVPGHPFGLDLAPSDRSALVAYLQAL
jgi:cytochrome c553